MFFVFLQHKSQSHLQEIFQYSHWRIHKSVIYLCLKQALKQVFFFYLLPIEAEAKPVLAKKGTADMIDHYLPKR